MPLGGQREGLDIGGLLSHNLSCITVRERRWRMLDVGAQTGKTRRGEGVHIKCYMKGKNLPSGQDQSWGLGGNSEHAQTQRKEVGREGYKDDRQQH